MPPEVPIESHRERGPANALIWGVEALKLWNNTFLLFEACQFVVLCYISSRKLIQHCVRGKKKHTSNQLYEKLIKMSQNDIKRRKELSSRS